MLNCEKIWLSEREQEACYVNQNAKGIGKGLGRKRKILKSLENRHSIHYEKNHLDYEIGNSTNYKRSQVIIISLKLLPPMS